MTLLAFIGTVQGPLLTWGGAALFCAKMPRRKLWWLSLAAGFAVHIAQVFVWRLCFSDFNTSNWFMACSTYFLMFIIPFLTVLAAFDCKVFAALFCATVGYCTQHLVQRFVIMTTTLSGITTTAWLRLLLLAAYSAVVYPLVYFTFKMRNGRINKGVAFNNPLQLLVAVPALIVMIVTEYVMIDYVFDITDKFVLAGNFVQSLIFVTVILFLEWNLVAREDYRVELDTVKQIMRVEREQYAFEKTVIDTINVKCHDLKHQLSALGGRLDEDELGKMMTAVDVYDSSFKTGSAALDVVLTMKSMVCKSKNIELTCLIDGSRLAFMRDADIYSLFGNILDNAIEAVDKIEESDRRVISLVMQKKDSFLFITAENHYSTPIAVENGQIQTSKSDKRQHGYGLRSINMIVKNYNGDCNINTDNGVFTLNIMFLI